MFDDGWNYTGRNLKKLEVWHKTKRMKNYAEEWKQKKIKGDEIRVCSSVNTFRSCARDNPCSTLQFNKAKMRLASICVATHNQRQTHTNTVCTLIQMSKCTASYQSIDDYSIWESTTTTWCFSPTAISFLSSFSLIFHCPHPVIILYSSKSPQTAVTISNY